MAGRRARGARGLLLRRVLGCFGVSLGLCFGGFGLQQALPVGDGDLVVVGMDFAEGQEAVPVAAVFNESGLEAGLYPNNLGEVDVALNLLLGRSLDVEVF